MKRYLLILLLLLIPQVSSAAISATNLTTVASTTSNTTYVTASVSPTANKLQLLCIGNQVASSWAKTPTVTGNGLTWVLIASTTDQKTHLREASLFRAMGSSPSSGSITIDFSGQSQTRAGWSLAEITGMDTTGTNGSGAIVQSASATTTDTLATTTIIATLAAFSSASNATYGCLRYGASYTTDAVTVGSGFTSIGSAASTASYASEFLATNDTTVDYTYNSVSTYNELIAVEIAAATATASVPEFLPILMLN